MPPDLEVKKVLKGGAVSEFSSITFSACGLYFASLGGGPPSVERRLVVWNWREEKKLAEKTTTTAGIFSLKHESSIFRSVIQPFMWFLHNGTG